MVLSGLLACTLGGERVVASKSGLSPERRSMTAVIFDFVFDFPTGTVPEARLSDA